MSCVNGGNPLMNNDVSGIGVLCVRSQSLNEITGALYTLLFTNTAMAVTALILGLKPTPEISFHEFSGDVKILYIFYIVESYTVFAFTFALLITAESFGSSPECNQNTVVVLFRPFSALKSGRILGWVMTVIVAAGYTALLVKDHITPLSISRAKMAPKRFRKAELITLGEDQRIPAPEVMPAAQNVPNIGSWKDPYPLEIPAEPIYEIPIAWDNLLAIIGIVIFWTLAVMNTELLIRWNHFAASSESLWQFGQECC
ncbi:hypothetical protein B0H10DRAFT_2191521 [Mycena sp. CBHHK59/15]|nr:hypothetical protein B0H10DRAFT_2191521 [Mycena sp. CBHHK59/15]